VLVNRLAEGGGQVELVDVLFALTSFQMWDALFIRQRSAEAVETLIQQLVDDTLRRFSASASGAF
jgi:hypothetical protein